MALPLIMVAPNGARRTKADHPALPMTIDEIAQTALACRRAGAGAIHAHVRGADGGHILDAGLYAALLKRLAEKVPDMAVQISTEAVGLYSAPEQMQLVRTLRPKAISVALRELCPAQADEAAAEAFYAWCACEGIDVQHILYDDADVGRLGDLIARGVVPVGAPSVIYVLGRYSVNQESTPDDLAPFLAAAADLSEAPDWMVCAFGRGETACLEAALRAGGKVRVGFENSLWNADGGIAASNEERVAEIHRIAADLGRTGVAA
ncbi:MULTISPECIES: 3-keto-5-aminohexanoate cleavage protein [Mesorhizobium]|nr:3-keto-5-aminohexanoate cleavage protein [Mesorhizobium zhangyense]